MVQWGGCERDGAWWKGGGEGRRMRLVISGNETTGEGVGREKKNGYVRCLHDVNTLALL